MNGVGEREGESDDGDSKNPRFVSCLSRRFSHSTGSMGHSADCGGRQEASVVQRLSAKSVTPEVELSLFFFFLFFFFLLLLAVGGTFGLFVSRRSIRRGRFVGRRRSRSVGRSRSVWLLRSFSAMLRREK